MLSATTLAAVSGRPPNDNMRSICAGLDEAGRDAGLDRPHRLAHYLAQLGHESAGFHYDREIWGATAAQKRYEGRADLGNTHPGDGERFKGRTGGQITGRATYQAFTRWARRVDHTAPDFVRDPDAINTDPWEGLGPIWYWQVGNPTGQALSRYADANDAEMMTRRWNGGLNGYSDRLDWYTRAALVLLGRGPDDVRNFQQAAGLEVDGISGPRTRAALHGALAALPTLAPAPAGNPILAVLLALLRRFQRATA